MDMRKYLLMENRYMGFFVVFFKLQISSLVALLMAFLRANQIDYIFMRSRRSALSPDLKKHRCVSVGGVGRIMRPRYFLFAYSLCFSCFYM